MKSFKRWLLPLLIAYVGKFLLRTLLFTCKIKVKGLEAFHTVASNERCIMMLWHNRLGIMSELLYKFSPKYIYAAFISKSRDGDPLAKLADSYKTGRAIRVAHNTRHGALKNVIDNLREGKQIVVITPDGPRGPRYEAKPGIAMAAQETAAKVVPVTWTATRFWQLKTWDKMIFPKPFSTILVDFGEALKFEKHEQSLEEVSRVLGERLVVMGEVLNAELLPNKAKWPK